jgi:transposase
MEEAEKRGYKVICLPPCSPFLNPIEEFWTKIKIIVRRSPMTDRDSLVTRIVEVGKSVTAEDGQG